MNKTLIILLFLSISIGATAQSTPPSTATTTTEPVANETTPIPQENTTPPVNTPPDTDTATPAETPTNGEGETTGTPPPTSPHDPNAPTLAQLQSPKESELSAANTELLAKNAELEGRIAELTTQVNVLVNERSGQLYLYGALTVIISLLIGAFGAWFILNKKKSDW